MAACSVESSIEPVLLSISANILGLNIQYRIEEGLEKQNDINDRLYICVTVHIVCTCMYMYTRNNFYMYIVNDFYEILTILDVHYCPFSVHSEKLPRGGKTAISQNKVG